MASDPSGKGVLVTYTVQGPTAAPPTTAPPAPIQPTPAVTHQPLPLTGAPLTLELVGSFGLLVAGALAAWSAHRRARPRRAHNCA